MTRKDTAGDCEYRKEQARLLRSKAKQLLEAADRLDETLILWDECEKYISSMLVKEGRNQ